MFGNNQQPQSNLFGQQGFNAFKPVQQQSPFLQQTGFFGGNNNQPTDVQLLMNILDNFEHLKKQNDLFRYLLFAEYERQSKEVNDMKQKLDEVKIENQKSILDQNKTQIKNLKNKNQDLQLQILEVQEEMEKISLQKGQVERKPDLENFVTSEIKEQLQNLNQFNLSMSQISLMMEDYQNKKLKLQQMGNFDELDTEINHQAHQDQLKEHLETLKQGIKEVKQKIDDNQQDLYILQQKISNQ